MGGETFYQLLDKYTRELWVYRAYNFFSFFKLGYNVCLALFFYYYACLVLITLLFMVYSEGFWRLLLILRCPMSFF